MKRRKTVLVLIFIALLLFTPIPKGTYRDGGTKDYMALTYRIVVWNRLVGEGNIYHKNSVYWFPVNFRSIDELWAGEDIGEAGEDDDEEMIALKEKYPEYFGLKTDEGLEVYVWQLAPSGYSFGLKSGTKEEKTLQELFDMKGASADEMKAILSSYKIDESKIRIIPWQDPVSSYIGDYWVMEKDESPESVAKRRQEYIDHIHDMIF